MKPEQERKTGEAPMTARQERQLREAQALRANLLRRKQQQRSRPAVSGRVTASASQGDR
ncbi:MULTISPECIES: hypothetical protein [Acetobacteraceae]|uniref:Uncharacterized protein n=2 Tax=Acetobacteraceae TaxID=433 RepID=A0A7U7G515_9PROT|nr:MULTISPECIES: hypothetical protein [Acetobacteraceae]MCQ0041438.1 hypothetical protein [Bombella sp.]MBE1724084.1 hypothetical protein [Bombella apis]MBR9730424.1 hypothetical protein [Bombella apis]MCT6814242.1 hypothetical protein [Bombella apis]MCT6819722.1 hypothetical protein [Bombella apis]